MDDALALLSSPEAWVAFVSLATLEIVLGIDNIVFIAILTDKLPAEKQKTAYRLGLFAAMFSRIALLLAINWVMRLETGLFSVFHHEITGRELILLGGGVFLIGKSVHEIFEKVEGHEEEDVANKAKGASMHLVVLQIMVLDIIFSLDSVITAVGVADDVEVMVAAIVVAVLVMLIFAKPVGDFVNANPSMKVLALAFLMLIGVLLTAEAFEQHIDKGYIYFAMGFALLVELLNMRARKRRRPGGVAALLPERAPAESTEETTGGTP
jgi:predicted tellurium resistance membrane protein TerC